MSSHVTVHPFTYEWRQSADPPCDVAPACEKEDGGSSETVACRQSLRVLTFNILADSLAKGNDAADPVPQQPCPALFIADAVGGVAYPDGTAHADPTFTFTCPQDALVWDTRWPKLRTLILELDPDIIGLQEVDLHQASSERHLAHEKEIRKDLATAGYDGTFARKSGRACDGVGLFWRKSRLRQAGRTETWRLGTSVHVALAQPLRIGEGTPFVAVTTHLKAGLLQEHESARVEQAGVLLQRLKRHPNAIVLADINAHCRPASISVADEDGDRSSQLEPKAYSLLSNTLKSAYRSVLGDEPSFTMWGRWTDREVRLVCDYILLKGSLFDPVRVLQTPPAGDVLRYPERLPNADFPSDHFPLVADLAVVQSGPSQDGVVRSKRRKR